MKSSEPRPQCAECGMVLHPQDDIKVVKDISKGMSVRQDVFVGVYCCSDCILDAMARGWPEHRSIDNGILD